jgi:hypothetical protein
MCVSEKMRPAFYSKILTHARHKSTEHNPDRRNTMTAVVTSEQIKLKANFYNNIAAGAAVTGLVVPYISLYSSMAMNFGGYLENPLKYLRLDAIIGMGCAFALSFFFRSRANAWIGSIDEDS